MPTALRILTPRRGVINQAECLAIPASKNSYTLLRQSSLVNNGVVVYRITLNSRCECKGTLSRVRTTHAMPASFHVLSVSCYPLGTNWLADVARRFLMRFKRGNLGSSNSIDFGSFYERREERRDGASGRV